MPPADTNRVEHLESQRRGALGKLKGLEIALHGAKFHYSKGADYPSKLAALETEKAQAKAALEEIELAMDIEKLGPGWSEWEALEEWERLKHKSATHRTKLREIKRGLAVAEDLKLYSGLGGWVSINDEALVRRLYLYEDPLAPRRRRRRYRPGGSSRELDARGLRVISREECLTLAERIDGDPADFGIHVGEKADLYRVRRVEERAELALNILADVLGEDAAREHYRGFMDEVLIHLYDDCWTITDKEVVRWAELRSQPSELVGNLHSGSGGGHG